MTSITKPNTQLSIGSGLQNLGNTCFFNAVMQVILHNRRLSQELFKRNHSNKCPKYGSTWCIFCQMENTFIQTRNKKCYSPYSIVNNLKKIFKQFKLGRQQDSHEFLRMLIQGMQDAEAAVWGKMSKERQKIEQRLRKTKMFQIFGGTMLSIVTCLSCGHDSITKERYYELNIECQRSNTLEEGLERFFTTDYLKGSSKYLCQQCKQRVEAKKHALVESTPSTLTFQLKRFNNMLRKIGKFVKYPKHLQMAKYYFQPKSKVAQTQINGTSQKSQSQPQSQPKKVTFRLSGIVVHSGYSSYSGHYYSFVRVGDQWYKMDDSWVTKCNEDQVMGQTAYLLVYEKTKDQFLQPQQPKKVTQNTKSQMVDEKQEKSIQNDKNQKNTNKLNGNKSNHNHQPHNDKNGIKPLTNGATSTEDSSKDTVNDNIDKTKLKHEIIQKHLQNQLREQKQLEQNLSRNTKEQRQTQHKGVNGTVETSKGNFKIVVNGNISKQQERQEKSRQKPLQQQTLKSLKRPHPTTQSDPQENDSQSQEDSDYEVPGSLGKRKPSKQEAEQGLSLTQMLLKYAFNMQNLVNKLNSKRRVLRSMNRVRKYELVMKKRKVDSFCLKNNSKKI